MALLTDQALASGVTLNDLIHVVIPTDTSQNPAGSSYKATIQQVATTITSTIPTVVGDYLPLSGGTVSGLTFYNSGLSANTFSAVTIGSSSNCVTDLYVQNIHSCSPLNINPLNEGNVIVGANGTLTVDLTNNRVGINTQTPGYALMVSGTTSRFWYDPTFLSGRVQISGDTGLPSYYATIGPYLTKSSAGYQFGIRAWDDVSYPGYGKVGDSFVYASNESNGLNLINGPGTGTDDYIRFYAGKIATSTPDVHIQGTGTTQGYVGFGTTTPAERVDVNGRIKTSSIQITSGATNGYVLTSDASGNATWSLPTTAFTSGLTASTIYTNYIDFNTGTTVTQSPGRIYWDSGTGTLNVTVGDSTTGLIDLQVGQEEIVRVYNNESTTLQKGEIVYVSGSQGNRPSVLRAIASSDSYSVTTLGMVDLAIPAGSEGYVTTFGIISNLNTLGLTGGTPIWLSPTVAGGYTSTKPIAPEHTVLIGYVVRVSATVGSIFVNISNGWELDELHDVRISGVSEGDLLVRSSYSGTPVWVNSKTLPGSYTITGNTTIQNGLTATTISATTISAKTYVNLPFDKDSSVVITPITSLNTLNTIGTNGFMTISNGGTGSPSVASTNYYTMLPKNVVRCSANFNQQASIYSSVTSSIAPTLDFYPIYSLKFGIDQYISTMRAFFGISNSTVVPTNVEPDTLTNVIGICKPSTSDNFHLIYNDGSGTATTVDLGVNFPANTTKVDVYFMRLTSLGTSVDYLIQRFNSASGKVIYEVSGNLTTNIPATNVILLPRVYVSNTATNSQPAIMTNKITISFQE